ncbi:MAG: HlyD family secretion protein [Bacteroidetes bacterium]|nr:MAG: HlyD family secretion protein [Bacteroidota bacterium]
MQRTILLLSVTFLLFSCSRNDKKSDAYGNFEGTEIIVSAQVPGELMFFNIEEGDLLEKGAIIGLIDTTDLSLSKKLLLQQKQTIGAQLQNIRSEIEVQQQQLKNNLVNQKRIQNLYNEGAATQKQLDDINGLVDINKKQIAAIHSRKEAIINQMKSVDVQVEQVNRKIEKCMIVNPEKGTVLVKYSEAGELTGTGKPLYKLADLEKMKLKAYISGDQLAHISIGQEVEVMYDDNKLENKKITGIVEWISPTAEFTPKTIQTKEERVNLVYAVKVSVHNNGEIKIGMPGEFNFAKN